MTSWRERKKDLHDKKRRYRGRFRDEGLDVPWSSSDDVEEAIKKAEAARPDLTTKYKPRFKTNPTIQRLK